METNEISSIQNKIGDIINNPRNISSSQREKQQETEKNDERHLRSVEEIESEIVEYKYIGSNAETDDFNDTELLNCLQSSPNLSEISLILAKNITDISIVRLFELKPQLVSLEIVRCTSLTIASLNSIMQSDSWFDSMRSLSLRYFNDINHYFLINIIERYKNANELDFRNNCNLDVKECIRYMINPENYMEDTGSSDEDCYTIVNDNNNNNNNNEDENNENNERPEQQQQEQQKKEILIMCSTFEETKFNNNYLIIENSKNRIVFHVSK